MLYRLVVFLAFGLIISGGLSAQSGNKRLSLQAPDDGAIIVYAEGVVKVEGVQVDIGSRVPDGATLITGPGALAEVVFAQKNILHIGEATVVKLNLSKLQRTVELQQGSLGAVLHKLEKLAGGNLSLRTANSVASVRGTTFFTVVSLAEPNETYCCICNGKLELADHSNNNPIILESTHHKAISLQNTPTGRIDTPGSMVGHTDASIEALAARIGESIDWTTEEN